MSVQPEYSARLRDGSQVVFRTPEISEAKSLIAYLDAVRHETENIMIGADDDLPTVEAEKNWIRSHRDNDAALLIGAFDESQLVALAGVACGRMKKTAHVAEVGISVTKPGWGRGLGTELMNALIDFCRRHDQIKRMSLTVFADNDRAVHLYEKVGFQHEGRKIRHARRRNGDYVDVIQMGLWLED